MRGKMPQLDRFGEDKAVVGRDLWHSAALCSRFGPPGNLQGKEPALSLSRLHSGSPASFMSEPRSNMPNCLCWRQSPSASARCVSQVIRSVRAPIRILLRLLLFG